MPLSGRSLRIACPPKVNLYLRVVRRREDGYHELETVFQSVEGGDLLGAAPAEELSLACEAEGVPSDERNLVLRAALLLRESCPDPPGAALELVKRTPTGAGMGGGSADAAAALVLLNELWKLKLSRSRLRELAARLGSDVPFFLLGGTAVARGRGERLEPAPAAALRLVLLRPEVEVSTPWAYSRWLPERDAGPSLDAFLSALASGRPEAVAAALRNDLEPGVTAGVPAIAAAKRWLLDRGVLGAAMTGSGSVVFGICRDEAQAGEIASLPSAPGRVWTARALTSTEAALTPR